MNFALWCNGLSTTVSKTVRAGSNPAGATKTKLNEYF